MVFILERNIPANAKLKHLLTRKKQISVSFLHYKNEKIIEYYNHSPPEYNVSVLQGMNRTSSANKNRYKKKITSEDWQKLHANKKKIVISKKLLKRFNSTDIVRVQRFRLGFWSNCVRMAPSNWPGKCCRSDNRRCWFGTYCGIMDTHRWLRSRRTFYCSPAMDSWLPSDECRPYRPIRSSCCKMSIHESHHHSHSINIQVCMGYLRSPIRPVNTIVR